MNRKELTGYILETYHADQDFPWVKYPDYFVFRHVNNRKWFALVMDVPKNKLGLAGDERMDIVNVKCDPVLISSLRNKDGFFPAYHMNKTNWITISLEGTVPDDELKMLIDMSYEATAKKTKHK